VLNRIAKDHSELVWDEAVPRLAEASAAIAEPARWRLAMAFARLSSDPKRITQVQAYAVQNVPAGARKPLLGIVATIRQNIRIAHGVLPELDAYIQAHADHP
jgi:hypothetical protein